jgi:hypothetical protein
VRVNARAAMKALSQKIYFARELKALSAQQRLHAMH